MRAAARQIETLDPCPRSRSSERGLPAMGRLAIERAAGPREQMLEILGRGRQARPGFPIQPEAAALQDRETPLLALLDLRSVERM
jgi:hypothetical protein